MSEDNPYIQDPDPVVGTPDVDSDGTDTHESTQDTDPIIADAIPTSSVNQSNSADDESLDSDDDPDEDTTGLRGLDLTDSSQSDSESSSTQATDDEELVAETVMSQESPPPVNDATTDTLETAKSRRSIITTIGDTLTPAQQATFESIRSAVYRVLTFPLRAVLTILSGIVYILFRLLPYIGVTCYIAGAGIGIYTLFYYSVSIMAHIGYLTTATVTGSVVGYILIITHDFISAEDQDSTDHAFSDHST